MRATSPIVHMVTAAGLLALLGLCLRPTVAFAAADPCRGALEGVARELESAGSRHHDSLLAPDGAWLRLARENVPLVSGEDLPAWKGDGVPGVPAAILKEAQAQVRDLGGEVVMAGRTAFGVDPGGAPW